MNDKVKQATDGIIQAIQHMADAIIETVNEAGPNGAPGGSLYNALMTYGVSYSTYSALMGALEKAGKVTRRGHCYFPVAPVLSGEEIEALERYQGQSSEERWGPYASI